METILNQFVNDPQVNSLKDYLTQEDMMQILGNERKEIPYTKIFEWLFDSSRNQGYGALPAKLLLKMLGVNSWDEVIGCAAKENKRDKNKENKCDKKCIVDLWLDCKLSDGSLLSICIENKINSDTHDNQLARYYDKYKDENVMFCILAPMPEKISEKHSEYHEISYQMLMDYVLVPLKYINDNIIINYTIHAMECPSKSGQEPLAVRTEFAKQIENLIDRYKEFMLKVLKMNRDKNDAEIQDVLNYMAQDDSPDGKGYYLYLLNKNNNAEEKAIIGPFNNFNIEMLRALAALYIKHHGIVDEKAFGNSELAKVKMGDKLIFALEPLNTSYVCNNPKISKIEGEECTDINSKIYIYNQIRTKNQQKRLITAIKSLGFRILFNL